MWPPNSSDINPVDYRIWVVTQKRVCRALIRDVAGLQRRFMGACDGFQQRVVDEAIDQWRTALDAYRLFVDKEVEQLEHLL